MGDGALLQGETLRDLADAHLARHQGRDDLQARGICKHAEDLGQLQRDVIAESCTFVGRAGRPSDGPAVYRTGVGARQGRLRLIYEQLLIY